MDEQALRRIIREELRAALQEQAELARGIPVTDYDALHAGDWVRDTREDGSITFRLRNRDERGYWIGVVIETTVAYTSPSAGWPIGAVREVTFVDARIVRRGDV